MSGIQETELSPFSLSLFYRHIRLIVLKCPANHQKNLSTAHCQGLKLSTIRCKYIGVGSHDMRLFFKLQKQKKEHYYVDQAKTEQKDRQTDSRGNRRSNSCFRRKNC